MSVLTVRKLDEEVKTALRFRAARHGVSVEEEVRTILRQTVLPEMPPEASDDRPGRSWYRSIRELVEPHGGFELEIPPRSKAMREPPKFE